MMKNTLIILFLFIARQASIAQDFDYPKGAYMSFEEILNKNPANTLDLIVEKRTKSDIKMNGGNDYRLLSEDKNINKRFLKRNIYAYSKGDTLYLNCFQYKLQSWYAAVVSDGHYLVIKGGVSQNPELFKVQTKPSSAFAFGAIGGGIRGAKLAQLRFLYAIDKKTNEYIALDLIKLLFILENYADLAKEFEAELNQESPEVWLKYLMKINDTY